MYKIRNLIGMPVLCRRQRIGRLVQAELSPDLKCLEGVWVDCGLRGTRYIAAENLESIGSIAVMADCRGRRRRCESASMLCRAISADGARIGAITGAEIDEISFMVVALELTHGLWDDLFAGRSRVERYTINPVRREVIVLDSAQST